MNDQRRDRSRRAAVWSGLWVSLLGGLLGGCGRPAAPPAALIRGLPARVESLDPQRSADYAASEVLRDLYEGLTEETQDGGVRPAAAERWTVSPDGKVVTFTLRPDLHWSNGDPLVAEDYAAALRRAVLPATASPVADLLACVVNARDVTAGHEPPEALGVRALDDRTLEVRLRYPAPYLPALMAYSIAYPLHRPSLARYGDRFLALEHRVSNGPYRLVAEGLDGGLRLERNERYWNRAKVVIPSVQFLPFPEARAEWLRYRTDALDVTSIIPAAELDWARETYPNELQRAPQMGVYYLALNLARPDLKDHRGVREALSLAIDRQLLVRHFLRAGQAPAFSMLPPGVPDYRSATYAWADEPIAPRRARARALLAAAGFGPGHPLHLRLVYAQNETVQAVALGILAQWQDVPGLDVTLEAQEFRSFLATRRDPKAWDVLLNGWNLDYPDPSNVLEVFRSHAVQNDPGLADPAFDALLDAAQEEPDVSRRAARYAAAEAWLLDGYAVLPVYFVASRRLVKPHVLGARLNPMNHNYTKDWSLDRTRQRPPAP